MKLQIKKERPDYAGVYNQKGELVGGLLFDPEAKIKPLKSGVEFRFTDKKGNNRAIGFVGAYFESITEKSLLNYLEAK